MRAGPHGRGVLATDVHGRPGMVGVVLRCRCVGGCVCAVRHPRRAQGVESIVVTSMCRYRTIILGGASRRANKLRGGGAEAAASSS